MNDHCLYKSSLSLLTDFYQLTMAYAYWKNGMQDHETVFNLVFRRLPFNNGYAVCAGLATVIEYLQSYQFTKDDITYLASLKTENNKPLFDKAFLQYLRQLKFTCDIHAVEEGTLVFPFEPLLRIKGPLLQCQLLESALLNIINFQTLIATKAARVYTAAQGDSILEFGLRRAQGIDGALSASRAAFIGGCAATSNTLAGKLYGIPVKGTHAHSWIMAFPTELESFYAYANAMAENCILLVDTYHSLDGIKNAIIIGKYLKQQGKELTGIRLDSGDLTKLSIKARKLLDAAGLKKTIILASGDLNESVINKIKKYHAPIQVWGVGTQLTVGYDQPALDGIYKLAAIREPNNEWQYKLKLSETAAKISLPGLLQVKRYYKNRVPIGDVIYEEVLGQAKGKICFDITEKNRKLFSKPYHHIELLKPIFRRGKLVYKVPSLNDVRQNTLKELGCFPKKMTQLQPTTQYFVGQDENFRQLRKKLINKINKR